MVQHLLREHTEAVREAAAIYPHSLLPTLHSCSRGGNLCLSLEVWHLINFPWSVLQTPLHLPRVWGCPWQGLRMQKHVAGPEDTMAVLAELLCQSLDPCSPPGRWLSFLTPLPHFLCSPSATCGSWKWSDRAQGKGVNTVCVSENVKGTLLCILFHSWYSSLSPAELLWPTALRILLQNAKCSGDEKKLREVGCGGV